MQIKILIGRTFESLDEEFEQPHQWEVPEALSSSFPCVVQANTGEKSDLSGGLGGVLFQCPNRRVGIVFLLGSRRKGKIAVPLSYAVSS
jgi:hypothetical protein